MIGSIGNNDVTHKSVAPTEDEKKWYYPELFNLWFTEVQGNANYYKLDEIRTYFLNGGYFRYDLNDSLSVLSLNSISLNFKN